MRLKPLSAGVNRAYHARRFTPEVSSSKSITIVSAFISLTAPVVFAWLVA
ncbi:MAG: hypothetical protein AB8C46_21655 [Burkholderiaceae bacterium]